MTRTGCEVPTLWTQWQTTGSLMIHNGVSWTCQMTMSRHCISEAHLGRHYSTEHFILWSLWWKLYVHQRFECADIVNGAFSLTGNEFTQGDDNIITLKSNAYDTNADIIMNHFVPVRSTDLDIEQTAISNATLYTQGNLQCYNNPSLCDCTNATKGYALTLQTNPKMLLLNFTLFNKGELFANDFILRAYALNLATGKMTNITSQTITMNPFSSDEYTINFDTSSLAGMYDFHGLCRFAQTR